MMDVEGLRALYEYSCWMNDRILDATSRVTAEEFVAATDLTPRNLQSNLVHILDVEWSWRVRTEGAPEEVWRTELALADFPDVDSISARWRQESTAMRDYLDILTDEELLQPVSLRYDRQLPRWQILLHAINHGALARVEAAVLLTHYGHSPGDLDYLDFADPR